MTQKCNLEIIQFIKKLYNTENFIPLHEPKFIGNEKTYLNDCIDSTFVSSVGKYVDLFEKEFAKKVGAKYAVAVVNGTAALHTSLLLSDVTQHDEVITQPLTFVATCNAISYTGASPIFIDVDLNTMGLSPNSLKKFLETNCKMHEEQCINKSTNKTIKACIAMHTFGHPCKIDEIQKICKQYNIALIEDAAESLGSYYNKKHTGTYGLFGTFSFNGNKVITAGGGGVIVTDNELFAKKAKHLTTTAKTPHQWEFNHDQVGYNYRMPNINAALLLAQLEQLDLFLESKRKIASSYKEFFNNIQKIIFFEEPPNSKSNYWLNCILFENKDKRDDFLRSSNESGVMSRPIWTLMNELNMYKSCQTFNLKNAKYFADSVVNLPSSVIV